MHSAFRFCLWITILVLGLTASSQSIELGEIRAHPGPHEGWWFSVAHADFVVLGKLSYDLSKYLVMREEGTDRKFTTYYVKGELQIDRVLYANSAGLYTENLRYYVKHPEKPQSVLVPARRLMFEHMNQNDPPHLEVDGWMVSGLSEKPGEVSLMLALNQVYMFPIGDLVLEAVVPKDREAELKEVLAKRKHNLVNQPETSN